MESLAKEEKGIVLTRECEGSVRWKDDALHDPEGHRRKYFPEGQIPKSPKY